MCKIVFASLVFSFFFFFIEKEGISDQFLRRRRRKNSKKELRNSRAKRKKKKRYPLVGRGTFVKLNDCFHRIVSYVDLWNPFH